uniref:Amiloride-sensitive sodium channel n=1 Tax=Panagrellus redivivus TaxID=6233 RepID=A0A7E4VYW6_PANRE
MGRPSQTSANSIRRSLEDNTIDTESVVRHERVYLHIHDHEAREFSGLTTYHGMVRIYNSTTWPSRIFWCCVVCSCVSLFMIHCGMLLYGYHQKPTLTQVTVFVPQEGILMPHVTVCPTTNIVKEKLQGWNMSSDVEAYLLRSFNTDINIRSDVIHRQHAAFERYKSQYFTKTGQNFSLLNFFHAVGPKCKDIIKACFWEGLAIDDCCANAESVFTDYGYCVRLPNSMNAPRKQWFSGTHYGLELIIDTMASDIINDDYSENFELLDVGAKVAIHRIADIPPLGFGALSVPPGMKMYVGMKLSNITLLPKNDWGMCQSTWDPKIHGEIRLQTPYTATHCELNCHINAMIKHCGCVAAHMSSHADKEVVCDPLAVHKCEQSFNATQEATNCDCDMECQRELYDTQISYGNFIIRRFESANYGLRSEAEITYAKENYASIVLYMREVLIEKHDQQRQMQTADLLSNIAGSMGLFLGMSTVTLLEVFIFLFKSVWGTVNTQRQRQFVKAVIEEQKGAEEDQELIVVEEPSDPEDDEPDSINPEGSDAGSQQSRRQSKAHIAILQHRRPSNFVSSLALRRLSARPDRQGSTGVPQFLTIDLGNRRRDSTAGDGGHNRRLSFSRSATARKPSFQYLGSAMDQSFAQPRRSLQPSAIDMQNLLEANSDGNRSRRASVVMAPRNPSHLGRKMSYTTSII